MATDSYIADQTQTTDLKINTLKSRWTIFEEHVRLWMVGALITADLLSLFAAIYLASQIHEPGIIIKPSYVGLFSLFATTLVIMFARKGLYPGVGLNYVDELGQIVSSTSLTFLVMIAITFVLKTTNYYSRLILSITWLLCLGFIPFGRYLVRRLSDPFAIMGGTGGDHWQFPKSLVTGRTFQDQPAAWPAAGSRAKR